MRDSADKMAKYFSAVRDLGLVASVRTAEAHFGDLFAGIELAGKRMLDIGGESGVCSFYAANMGAAEVVCLEPEAQGSTWILTRAFDRIREAYPEAPVRLDTRAIQQFTSTKPFDVVFLRASINHMDEDACIRLPGDKKAWGIYKDVFARIASMMVPQGKIVIYDCTRRNFFALLGFKSPIRPTIEWRKHQTPQVWARLLAEAGFTDPRISWEPVYRLGKPGRLFLGNGPSAFFLKGTFRLEMTKP